MAAKYKVQCPKCRCKKIWVREWIRAYSEHLVDNGEWNHDYDYNDYGNGLRIEFTCDSCRHKWVGKKGVTIDSYLSES